MTLTNDKLSELLDRLKVAMGGRVAEEVVFHDPTTGASNDIEKATGIARKMVTEYGMTTEVGPVKLGSSSGEVFMSVSTNPESRTVFFYPDGSLLPAAALMGALSFWLAHGVAAVTTDLIGSLLIFAILIGLSFFIWWRAQQQKVDHRNVNADWDDDRGLMPAEAPTPVPAGRETAEI